MPFNEYILVPSLNLILVRRMLRIFYLLYLKLDKRVSKKKIMVYLFTCRCILINIEQRGHIRSHITKCLGCLENSSSQASNRGSNRTANGRDVSSLPNGGRRSAMLSFSGTIVSAFVDTFDRRLMATSPSTSGKRLTLESTGRGKKDKKSIHFFKVIHVWFKHQPSLVTRSNSVMGCKWRSHYSKLQSNETGDVFSVMNSFATTSRLTPL